MSGGGAGCVVRDFGIYLELWGRQRREHRRYVITAVANEPRHLRGNSGWNDPEPDSNRKQDPKAEAHADVLGSIGGEYISRSKADDALFQRPGYI